MKRLTGCGDNAEASMLEARLRSEGIEATVQGENHRSMLGTLGSYIELNVMVPDAQWGVAQRVLAEHQDAQSNAALLPVEDRLDGSRVKKRRLYGLVALMLLVGVPALSIAAQAVRNALARR